MVPGQFVAGHSSQDNSSQDNSLQNINLIEIPAFTSAPFFFIKIPLPFLQHFIHQSRFHFFNIVFITPASISARAGLTIVPFVPWHGAPRRRGPPRPPPKNFCIRPYKSNVGQKS